jgi:hypothetical protein
VGNGEGQHLQEAAACNSAGLHGRCLCHRDTHLRTRLCACGPCVYAAPRLWPLVTVYVVQGLCGPAGGSGAGANMTQVGPGFTSVMFSTVTMQPEYHCTAQSTVLHRSTAQYTGSRPRASHWQAVQNLGCSVQPEYCTSNMPVPVPVCQLAVNFKLRRRGGVGA